MVENFNSDWRPQVDLNRRTETGQLQTWYFNLREDMEVIDGDGEIFQFAQGSRVMVVVTPSDDLALVERALDRMELGVHNTYSMRPARTAVRTPFDIRTPIAGGREDSEDVPF